MFSMKSTKKYQDDYDNLNKIPLFWLIIYRATMQDGISSNKVKVTGKMILRNNVDECFLNNYFLILILVLPN